MSQMNSDTTMDQFDDEFDASRGGCVLCCQLEVEASPPRVS